MTSPIQEYRIPLSRGQYAIVNQSDHAWLSQWIWQAHWNSCTKSYYAVRSQRLERGRKGKKITVWMHREILSLAYKDLRRGDHISGDTLNNTRANLRIVDLNQNAQNARRRTDNTSGQKGVHWFSNTQKWCARIQVNKRRIALGHFISYDDAVLAYRAAAAEHHKEFARAK